MSPESIEIGNAIRAELMRRGLSQSDVAAQFQVTQPRISRVLQGEFTRRSELARRLCEVYLGIDLAPDAQRYAHKEIASLAFDKAVQALRLMWDGSADHADRLTRMIQAVRHTGKGALSEGYPSIHQDK